MLAVDLDRPLYYLGRDLPGVLDVLTLSATASGGRVAPVFGELERARLWAGRAPRGVAPRCAGADDPRARVELLEAFLAAGAVELWCDPGAPTAARGALQPSLDYLRSLRNASACL